ncbi:MAG: (d)CMP kinase [Chloroflexi bacterium]|nr:(d)CMP kinase [Chloroflexota bacterium]MCH8225208.1 (d)CMP kinase [Chloroflexota bacterium]MCI0846531.1 (d)CMP kinase [Chloroflexota bacterium]
MSGKVSVIALDGPVASGKSVVGRELARRLAFRYLDTGVMYRAITWLALRCGTSLADEESLGNLANRHPIRLSGTESNQVWVGEHQLGPELRDARVERQVSLVSRMPQVRRVLVQQQRTLAKEGNIVMVGRDIGTVVLPNADVKVYLSASPEARAHRRLKDLVDQGQDVDFQQVLGETIQRDDMDSNRADSPLRPAEDALTLDTGELTIDQVVEQILAQVHRC